MKNVMIATAACVLCAGFATNSIAEGEPSANSQTTSVETIVADLEHRVEQLEAKVGGETVGSAFQARGSKIRHLSPPVEASNLE